MNTYPESSWNEEVLYENCQVFGFRVLLWFMLSNLSGSHRCILPKEDPLHGPLPFPEMLISHPENSTFTTYGYGKCKPRDIAYSHCSSKRHIHSPKIFSFICFFSRSFDNLRHQRYLSNSWTRTSKPNGPAPSRKTMPEHIYLVFGVVIFDELWAFTDIDIRVSTVHCSVFDDSEVNLATLLIYSEYRFADIQGNARGAHCDDNVLYFFAREIMPDKFWEVQFLFLA